MNTVDKISKNEPVVDLIQKGWSLHAGGEDDAAEESFRKALTVDSNSIEALYGLALTLKSQGRRKDTVQVFEQIVSLLDNRHDQDLVRSNMLRRLAKAHIQQIQSGDWNLEKEIWQTKN
jgi:tetratricopeptide (TPR) repeat protein